MHNLSFGYAFPFEGNWNSALAPGGLRSPLRFGYAFPFEGNWNSSDLGHNVLLLVGFGYAFPFEGNWNPVQISTRWFEYINFGYAFPFEGNWNNSNLEFSTNHSTFGYAFPFEGNWNFTSWSRSYFAEVAFGYAFPFEGNWNLIRCCHDVLQYTLDMPSRLKGIETQYNRHAVPRLYFLWICLPVWRELKPKYSPFNRIVSLSTFGYAFPFEGNWNYSSFTVLRISSTPLDMPSRLKGIETCMEFGCNRIRFYTTLDMPSRLKGIETSAASCECSLTYRALDMPSRLKGIETSPNFSRILRHDIALDMPSRLKGIETIVSCVP